MHALNLGIKYFNLNFTEKLLINILSSLFHLNKEALEELYMQAYTYTITYIYICICCKTIHNLLHQPFMFVQFKYMQ